MTTEDVRLFLDTLWTRAEHIPCTPSIRNAVHCVIMLGAFGGWRPGSLMNIKYQDVEFGWFSHPRHPNKIWPVVTINIHHVKQRTSQVERTQRSMLLYQKPLNSMLINTVTGYDLRYQQCHAAKYVCYRI